MASLTLSTLAASSLTTTTTGPNSNSNVVTQVTPPHRRTPTNTTLIGGGDGDGEEEEVQQPPTSETNNDNNNDDDNNDFTAEGRDSKWPLDRISNDNSNIEDLIELGKDQELEKQSGGAKSADNNNKCVESDSEISTTSTSSASEESGGSGNLSPELDIPLPLDAIHHHLNHRHRRHDNLAEENKDSFFAPAPSQSDTNTTTSTSTTSPTTNSTTNNNTNNTSPTTTSNTTSPTTTTSTTSTTQNQNQTSPPKWLASEDSMLHRAAFNGHKDAIKSLLKNIDDPVKLKRTINKKNRLGCTPVRLAATAGHLECLSALIEAGASIDKVDVKCQTPLFVATKNRRLLCAKRLLQAGAKPEGHPGNSSTPLYVAIMNGDVRYIQLLLEFGADPDKVRHSRVSSADYLTNGNFRALNLVVINVGGEENVLEGVKALLMAGCDKRNLDILPIMMNDYSQVLSLTHQFGVPFGPRKELDEHLVGSARLNKCQCALQNILETPHSLASLCRIAITERVQACTARWDALSNLPLPSAFIHYLKYQDE